jgi:hypothetical protein
MRLGQNDRSVEGCGNGAEGAAVLGGRREGVAPRVRVSGGSARGR